ncbi:hypothetical protein EPN95_04595 [Patescibacteria group bacterium]|nr:MAG: hypothetical protein EPN95_04595 [Patescibacteria group bacterium]
MARSFDAIDDLIDLGSPALLDNVNIFSWGAWIYPKSLGEASLGAIVNKGSSSSSLRRQIQMVATSTFQGRVGGTTVATAVAANNTITFNAWQFIAMTHSTANGLIKLYHALPQNALAEVTYASQVAGATPSDDSALNWFIGNASAGNITFDGFISSVTFFNVQLALEELQMLMRGKIPRRTSLIGHWELYGVASPEPDFSGNQNNGTVTGAVLADHAPVGRDFQRVRKRGILVSAAPSPTLVQLERFQPRGVERGVFAK